MVKIDSIEWLIKCDNANETEAYSVDHYYWYSKHLFISFYPYEFYFHFFTSIEQINNDCFREYFLSVLNESTPHDKYESILKTIEQQAISFPQKYTHSLHFNYCLRTLLVAKLSSKLIHFFLR